jgi:nucleotide-binding universal stress UspA family protein
VSVVVTPDPPGLALVREARDADLLVVGSRGPLALARLTLQSVSRAVLDVMPCPVQLVLSTSNVDAETVETEPARV